MNDNTKLPLQERIQKLNDIEKGILKLLAQIIILPRNTSVVLSAYTELNPEWKYNKAIKNLKARGFIQSIGIDCKRGHNEKDAHILTRRGYAACNELKYSVNPELKEISRYKKHYYRSIIFKCIIKAFERECERRLPLIYSSEILKETDIVF